MEGQTISPTTTNYHPHLANINRTNRTARPIMVRPIYPNPPAHLRHRPSHPRESGRDNFAVRTHNFFF